jgi:hypothetical protein
VAQYHIFEVEFSQTQFLDMNFLKLLIDLVIFGDVEYLRDFIDIFSRVRIEAVNF